MADGWYTTLPRRIVFKSITIIELWTFHESKFTLLCHLLFWTFIIWLVRQSSFVFSLLRYTQRYKVQSEKCPLLHNVKFIINGLNSLWGLVSLSLPHWFYKGYLLDLTCHQPVRKFPKVKWTREIDFESGEFTCLPTEEMSELQKYT